MRSRPHYRLCNELLAGAQAQAGMPGACPTSPHHTWALVRSCMRTCHRRDVDDARPALLSHGRRQHARQPHRRRQVQVQQLVRSIGVAWHMIVTMSLL